MSRTQSDFSEAQRGAVVSAVLLDGMSARAVAAAAFAGTLGVPSFKISPSSVSAFAREERAEHDGGDRPQDGHDLDVQVRLDALHDRLIDLAEGAVGEVEDDEAELDVGRLRQLVGLVRSLAKQPGATPARRSGIERETSPLLARLAVVAEGAHEAGDDNGDAA